MNNSKKFENIKEELIFINEKQYKDEVVKRWGIYKYELSKSHFKNMSNEQF